MNTTEFRIHRGIAAAVLALSVCAVGAACGSGGSSGESASSGTATSAGEASAAGEAPAVAIDACGLIPADKITSLLGVPIEGKPTNTNPDMPSCIWENPANSESVSLEIGNSDTAINGTLPPAPEGMGDMTKPGPDGMRFLGSGSVEFAAGKRSNRVQVAVLSMLGDQADNAAVELARQVSSQLNR